MPPRDGVNPERFAVIIAALVLDLTPPCGASWEALLAEWPTGVNYAVSYLFAAIVWVNHHYILCFADSATAQLIRVNFAHLFTVSLLPFSPNLSLNRPAAAGPSVAPGGRLPSLVGHLNAGIFANRPEPSCPFAVIAR